MAEEQGLLRSNAPTIILALLKEGSRHGYDIGREVERRSDRTINFKHATLYTVLHSLEEQGLISSEWEIPDGERPRRVYSLTQSGHGELEHALRSWDDFANAMNRVLARPIRESA